MGLGLLALQLGPAARLGIEGEMNAMSIKSRAPGILGLLGALLLLAAPIAAVVEYNVQKQIGVVPMGPIGSWVFALVALGVLLVVIGITVGLRNRKPSTGSQECLSD